MIKRTDMQTIKLNTFKIFILLPLTIVLLQASSKKMRKKEMT